MHNRTLSKFLFRIFISWYFFPYYIAAMYFWYRALVLGSILPDTIEPPTDKFHRKKFHSTLMLGIGLILLGVSIFLIVKFGSHYVIIGLCSLSLGYSIHLALASTTPMGLLDD